MFAEKKKKYDNSLLSECRKLEFRQQIFLPTSFSAGYEFSKKLISISKGQLGSSVISIHISNIAMQLSKELK